MSELLAESGFHPIERIAELSYLVSSYANQLRVAQELDSDSVSGLRKSIREIGEEALELKERYGISETDFFEATFQTEGWRDRITHS